MCANLGLDNPVDIAEVEHNRDHDGDSDGEEGEAHLTDVEAVFLDVDQRKGFEEGVVDCVAERNISCRESDCRVHDDQLHWAD